MITEMTSTGALGAEIGPDNAGPRRFGDRHATAQT
jgi:hypothetical protein